MRAKEQEHFRRHTIGFMFQFHYLIQELTVLDNCLLPARVAGVSTGLATEKAASLLESVGLADKQDRYPWQLSGGEQQRVSLARALVNQPAMLFADEPTGNLDADNAARMVELLLSCQRQWGMTVMICSHDAVVYKQMGHVFWLEGGTLRGA
jgi:lipoprotein-releasing system ATP-binding protein